VNADWAAWAAPDPYRRCAAATVARAAAANDVSGAKANWASTISVVAVVSPSARGMSHSAADQIFPSAWWPTR
jgi:hypothetical protein